MKFFKAAKEAAWDFIEDDCMSSGAALAYYTIFALPPLLIIVFAVAGRFGVDDQQIDTIVKEQLGIPITEFEGADLSDASLVGEESGNDSDQSSGNIAGLSYVSRAFGLGVLFFSVTGLFSQFQYSLNRVWEVKPDPDRSTIKEFVLKRLLSLGMVAIIAFLLLVSLVLSTLMDEAMEAIQGPNPGGAMMVLGIIVNNVITVIIGTLLFASMFKVLPDARTSWRDMFVGSFLTAVLFVIGKALIGWYLQNSNVGSDWGSAASSLIAVLVWVYYSSLIVLFGAELTQVWAKYFGSGIQPTHGAVRMIEERRTIREDPPPEDAEEHRG
ncbi:MAG: ribonuclease BN [Planctomyces sp.]|nr:ribonuclease BN [Planctomyces sp.]